MRVIQIKNSYRVWRRVTMQVCLAMEMLNMGFPDMSPADYLYRSYRSMYIEWWMHNIGYYLSLPLKKWEFWRRINQRCKDVDLEEWV